MPIIVPPSTDEQVRDSLSILEELAPPCEYSAHGYCGNGPATLIVYYDLRAACLCYVIDHLLFCDSCWAFRCSRGATSCPNCYRVYAAMETILRIERI